MTPCHLLLICAVSVYTIDPSERLTRPVAPEYYKESLSCFAQVFRRTNLQYFLSFGTLLGHTRNGTLLPWDGDIDVGYLDPQRFDSEVYEKWHIWQSEIPECARLSFYTKLPWRVGDFWTNWYFIGLDRLSAEESADFDLSSVNPLISATRHTMCIAPCVAGKDSIKCIHPQGAAGATGRDIWNAVDGAMDYVQHFIADNAKVVDIPTNSLKPLKQCQVEGINTMCPAHADELCRIFYGDDWRTPAFDFYDGTSWVKRQKA